MTNLENELIYLSQLLFDDRDEVIEEIQEAGGIVRVAEEGADFIYYGADGRPFGISKVRLEKVLVKDKLIKIPNYPTDDDLGKPTYFEDFKRASNAGEKQMMDFLEKLRKDIESGKISV